MHVTHSQNNGNPNASGEITRGQRCFDDEKKFEFFLTVTDSYIDAFIAMAHKCTRCDFKLEILSYAVGMCFV